MRILNARMQERRVYNSERNVCIFDIYDLSNPTSQFSLRHVLSFIPFIVLYFSLFYFLYPSFPLSFSLCRKLILFIFKNIIKLYNRDFAYLPIN